MELWYYINYHYLDENPKWLQNAMGQKPKSMIEILNDLFIHIVLTLIMVAIFHYGTRFLRFLSKLHNEELRKMEELAKIRTSAHNTCGAGYYSPND